MQEMDEVFWLANLLLWSSVVNEDDLEQGKHFFLGMFGMSLQSIV